MVKQNILRPALRYPGAKFAVAQTILGYFPDHDCFVDVFGGGGSISYLKSPSKIEVYNDIDHEIVNFFRMLRERREALIEAIKLTPYSRKELEMSFEVSEDPLESARRLFVRLWQSYGASLTEDRGWRVIFRDGHDVVSNWNDQDHLWIIAERFKNFEIDCQDYSQVINRYDTPDTLFFLDPPYVLDTRRKNLYRHEMTDSQHLEMLEKISKLQGKVILCGFESPLYSTLIEAGWAKIFYDGRSNGGGGRSEILWMSPNCIVNKQISLFP